MNRIKKRGVMKKNDVVKFKDPDSEIEKISRFVLLEDPDGPRVLVKEIYDMPFPRTTIFNVDELVVCNMTAIEEAGTLQTLLKIVKKCSDKV
jgi:hypothetical protein